ncbi:ROK family protein [Nitratireductor kimnyeongensis]|uniref:ROK family protein n=1 Tax=Nitratireductor kimnyeongensis TaxID=430679 RepID=A0ABW0T8R5_9HYPH|nr:ROK family protein [Nitratireductor kimnyeongensis]QZZ36201.1 ROK family protein [Nitratireductor kimnyeongensis]
MLCCFDIGGSKTVVADMGDDEMPVIRRRQITPADDYAAFLETVKAMAGEGRTPVGISIAAVINPHTGLARSANIPCITGRNIARDLGEGLGRPVFVMNDANAFAFAEAKAGVGVGHRHVLAVIIGTGIGGAVVIDGKVMSGATGNAGEWGHGPASAMRTGTPLPAIECGCGQRGCVDTLGAARGIERLHEHLHGLEIDSFEILAQWHGGGEQATRTVDVFLDIVGGALANTVNMVDPSIVPVSGGLAQDGPLMEALDLEVRQRCLIERSERLLIPVRGGVESALIGAAIFAREAYHAGNS